MEDIVFCKGGGCTAKLGADVLKHILSKIPKGEKDISLLVGYDSSDDAAVYRISDDMAIVQTLDFFPPMVDDPYIFGQIAAANALSDVYAMGGEVKTALNIVCFPEKMDLNILGKIMQGGAKKVNEAGATLAGGHSIADDSVKYGLSVMGLVNPDKIYENNKAEPTDILILTKKLGVGLVCNAQRVGQAFKGSMDEAIESMTTLNKKASEISRNYEIHACTDVTGFGLLGHLNEMINNSVSVEIDSISIPVIKGALHYAEEFLLTAAAQRNRNHVGDNVDFSENITFAMEELLFDPQTSGGLLFAVKKEDALPFLKELKKSINEDTFLVSIMWVNNELGSINDIPTIANICNENNIFLHVDATQAIGKIDVNLPKGVSSASFSAHKIHGPKGVGAIILRKDQDGVPVKLTPLIHGGEQESGYRAGTQSVHNIIGLSKAVEICMRDFKKNQKKLLEDEIWVKKILQNKLGSKLKINSPENGKVPGIINFQIKGVQNTIFLKKISKEIAASSGSACSITRPSYTLKAIGLSDEEIQNSVRFSLSPYEDISELNKIL